MLLLAKKLTSKSPIINPLQIFNQTNYGFLVVLFSLTSFLGLVNLL